MKYNANGSLAIDLQADNPGKDKEANRLPAPRAPFLVILGTYALGEAVIEPWSNPNAYVPPPAVGQCGWPARCSELSHPASGQHFVRDLDDGGFQVPSRMTSSDR